MKDLGRFLRRKYIDEEPVVPPQFEEDLVYITSTFRTRIYTSRTIQSAESIARGLYPEDIPLVYLPDSDRDFVTRGPENCASYQAEWPRQEREYNEFLRVNYGDFIDRVSNLTGVIGSERTIVHSAEATVECSQADHLDYLIDPFITGNHELLLELGYGYFFELYSPNGNVDPRGTVGSGAVEEMVRDIRGLLSNEHERKLTIHTGHRSTTASVFAAFDFGPVYATNGFFFVQEFRRDAAGEIFVSGYTITSQELADGTYTYPPIQQLLSCPTPQERCPLDDWQAFLLQRAGLGYERGCCVIGAGFFDMGCADYLNPATLEIPECRLYRTHCPAVACGTGNYLDASTLLCVPLGKTVKEL